MLFLLLFACQSTEGSWETVFEPVPVEAPAAEASDTPDPMADEFAKARALDQQQAGGWDDLSNEGSGDASSDEEIEDEAEAPEAAEAPAIEAPEAVVEAAPALPAPIVDAPPAVGLPTQPAWGLRLLGTIPAASPPRAAIGLPDGRELVVSPGTLLPEVGVIVISVGPNSAQLARVTPAGDHANIESTTLFAQYGGGAASSSP